MRRAALLLAVVAVGCGTAAVAAGPPARLVGKPPAFVVGQTWRPVVEVRGATRARVRARLGSRVLTVATVRLAATRYSAALRFPAPGRWTVSALLGRRVVRLAYVVVAPAGYALALPAQLLVADGAILVAERQGRDRLLRVDPATGAFSVFGTGVPEPFAIARARDGSFLVSGESGLYRLPPGGGYAELVAEVEASPIALAPDGDVYFGNATSLGRIELESKRVEFFPADVSVPHGVALAPDGSLVVTDTGHDRVVRFEPESGETTVVASGLRAPVGLALEPSGAILVAEHDAGTVLRIGSAGTRTVVASGLAQP